TGRTLTSFVFEVITLTFYLSYIWFIIMVYQGNISTVWTSEWVYAGLLGSMSFIYLKSGKWRGSEV
ncbi:MAG: MATE family efflux transporter, partial [Bacteroidales bacterium]|nr:MATE family efflux transporter [Bacteroidales bacterium]